MDKWDFRFLELAGVIASWSKDPSTKVGAVIVRPDRTIASLGYNGFPRGCDDRSALYEDRAEKYQRVVHAEMNAVLAAAEPVRGYTLYCTIPPCDRCAAHIIQAGIGRVICGTEQRRPGYERMQEMLLQAGVRYGEVEGA